MFELNVFNTEQLGTLLSWFVANRGPCSVLVHPNTGNDVNDHTTHATWIGDKVNLDVDMLRAVDAMHLHAAKNDA
jgi:DOPA 4,5-dioxygenase